MHLGAARINFGLVLLVPNLMNFYISVPKSSCDIQDFALVETEL
jgi:hypothetical protein